MLTLLAIYLAVGAVAGILAGLLGIGGGLVIVPMLVFCFSLLGIPEVHTMHIALGTSLASIIFTSFSSFMAHHRRGAVEWPVVVRLSPGIVAGTLLGAYIASLMSTGVLKGFFGLFLYYVSIQFFLDRKPKPGREPPGPAGMLVVGGGIGIISSLMGIGGGTLSVPFLTWCNLAVRRAIGTSAAIGLPIAVSGTIGYVVTGFAVEGLPSPSFGYVYLPALFGIVGASMLTAPAGAWLAHRLPVPQLKRVFALLLFLVGTRMVAGLF